MKKMPGIICGLVISLSLNVSADVIVKATGAKASTDYGAGRTAAQTIDGSGLSADYTTGDAIPTVWSDHETGSSLSRMWLTGNTGPEGAEWIMFDLGAEYELTGLHVWNYNEDSSVSIGYGIEDLDIYFATSSAGYDAGSESDASWGGAVSKTFAMGSASADYAGEDITFPSVTARYVLFNTETTHWRDSTYSQYNRTGLSEVMFTAVPEPATIGMLGIGSLITMSIRRFMHI